MTESLISEAFSIGMAQYPEEISALIERVRGLAPTNIMEIGSLRGGTFYLWCQLASGLKISLDFPQGRFGFNHALDMEEVERRASLFKSWAPNVHVVNGDSHQPETKAKISSILGGELLDFLLIDGDHSREGVEQDWDDYSGLVRSGGLIAVHDIRDSEYHRVNGCLVPEFWKGLEVPKEEIIDPLGYWGGIGLIAC
jgi:cephalosporin hydroxylase